MYGYLFQAEDVLRRRRWATQPTADRRAIRRLSGYVLVFGAFYGGVMGSFAGVAGQRAWTLQLLQMAYSAAKVPLLLSLTFLIALPSFFVVNTLLGLRRDFAQALRALVATQAALGIILASLAPLTIFWYVSWKGYEAAILFNALMFALASLSAQWLLRGYYEPLVARSRRHRVMMWAWMVVYAFVGIQMGWVLRPFVGSPAAPVQFVREEAWDNAYVLVAKLVWKLLAG
jgi:hypothetical protein